MFLMTGSHRQNWDGRNAGKKPRYAIIYGAVQVTFTRAFHQKGKTLKTITAMKNFILIFACMAAGLAAQAQTDSETLMLTRVKKGEEPSAVMAAIKQDFPKAIVGDLNILPAKLYGERWSVNVDDQLNGATPDLYMVNMKEKGEQYKAVYDKKGNLMSSKTVVNKAALPSEVSATIHQKYPDWTIVNDREKITTKQGAVREIFHVEIHKNKQHRNLFVNPDGTMVKDALRHS